MAVDVTAFVLGGTGGLRRRDRGAWRGWIGIAFVTALILVPVPGLYRFTGGTMEEGFMLYFPERMARGDVPNVDFLHLYGPGSLHVLTGWYGLFGHTLVAERTFGLVQHVAIIFALFTLARPWGRMAATAVGTTAVFYVLTPIGLSAMAWNGGLGLTLWSAVFVVRGCFVVSPTARTWSWVIAGVLGGMALSYRPDLLFAVGAVFAWLLVSRRAARPWRPVLAGGVVGLTPMWVHLAMAGPKASWQGMFVDPVFHLRAGRELPRPPSWDRLDGALQKIAEFEPTPWWDLPHLSASNAIFLWFFAMLIVAAGLLAFAAYRWWNGVRDGRATVLLVVALVSAGLLPQALQRPDSTHLTWVTCVTWPFLIVAVVEVVQRRWPQVSMRRALAFGGAFTLLLTFTLTALFTFRYYLMHARASYADTSATWEVRRGDRTFYFGHPNPALASQLLIDDLSALASPGERLFVGPNDLSRTWYSDTVFYWFFPELEPATYFIEMDPGLANRPGSRLADDLATADWVILSAFWAGWNEPNSSMDFGSAEPTEVLNRHFCERQAYLGGLLRLYYRCR